MKLLMKKYKYLPILQDYRYKYMNLTGFFFLFCSLEEGGINWIIYKTIWKNTSKQYYFYEEQIEVQLNQ